MIDKLLDKTRLKNNFDRAATTYDEHAVVQKIVLNELLDQLNYLVIKPKTIIDLGSGTGLASKTLKKLYPKATLIQSDLSFQMLKQAAKKQRWQLYKDKFVQTDIQALPFKHNSVDLIFSSLCLQWSEDFVEVFREIRSLLKPDGVMIFSTLGENSMKEFRTAWAFTNKTETHKFYDIRKYGDALMTVGFDDPVLSVDTMVMKYDSIKQVSNSIKKVGASNVHKKRNKNLTSKQDWNQFKKNYEKFETAGKLPLTYEVIYGLAWTAENKQGNQINIPVENIKKRML